MINKVRRALIDRSYPFILSYTAGGKRFINIPGAFTLGDVEAYRTLVGELTGNGPIVEVGSWKGRSIINLACSSQGGKRRLIAVDTFKGSAAELTTSHKEATKGENRIYFQFLSNLMLARAGNVSVLRMTSQEAADLITNESLDLVFIDAGHTYPEVCEDIRIWRSKVKPGGTMCGHDWHKDDGDVARAVRDSLGNRNIRRFAQSSIWSVQL